MNRYFIFLVILSSLVACRRGARQQETTTASIARDTAITEVTTDATTATDTVPAPVVETAVTPPAVVEIMAPRARRFHVIVASQPTRALAEKEVKHYRSLGYPGTSIVFKDGVHYRVSIASFPTKKEALDNVTSYSRKLKVR
ncbi:MAG: SPOR domain-containing protein, partial [Odoribacteraceae bacterium]|nr:SPOR domain-containing protein [Odoribacteraceae bacterium]